jgi:hypothetical protein
MYAFNTWGDAVLASFQNLWIKLVSALPNILGALIILAFGMLLASALGMVVTRLVKVTRVDDILAKTRLPALFKDTGMHFSLARLAGWVAKWFLMIVALLTVADVLHWTQVTVFLQNVALYVPNVLVAVVILTVGLVVGRYVHEVVERAVKASKLPAASAGTLALVAEWAIVVFAIMAVLAQLGVAARLVEILLSGLVFGLALAFGLAFGLGGRDKAKEWLEKVDRQMSSGK